MGIDFDSARWEHLKRTARAWWAGELDRPMICLSVSGRDPGRKPSTLAQVSRDTTSYDLSVSPEEIIDWWDYRLSCERYLGDGFPSLWPDFGPGVAAAFAGADVEIAAGTVWFHPRRHQAIADISLSLDPRNHWLDRVKSICRAAIERWNGLVQVGMTDLGGNLDVVSTFRPGEALLTDLYDNPDEVKRLTWEAHRLWWSAFDDINRVLHSANPGYTAWTPIFSEVPYYILQCDFSYMISTRMFDEFVKPELAATAQRLGNAFYHLDGIGQLPHLDSLLEIDAIKGVQWVPGTGQPDYRHWPEVFRKIRGAGKLIQIWGDPLMLESIADILGDARGICLIGWADEKDVPEINRALSRYGIPTPP